MQDLEEVAYGFSIGTNFDDLEWPSTTIAHYLTLHSFFWDSFLEMWISHTFIHLLSQSVTQN